jgi:phenylacetate-CoA ligase
MPGVTPAYFAEADPARILDEYPLGEEFLAGPARLGGDALRALQDRRFLEVVARGWQVPFYARRWRAAGLEPGALNP